MTGSFDMLTNYTLVPNLKAMAANRSKKDYVLIEQLAASLDISDSEHDLLHLDSDCKHSVMILC
jgi:hypothetical protein